MKSRVLVGAAMALFVASMGVPGLPAQEPEAGQPASGASFKTLVVFEGPNGGSPYAGLFQGADGNLYGTTLNGGASNAGTVFTVSTVTGKETVLYSFTGGADGGGPFGGLIEDATGNLYGTAGGGAFNAGTVFTVSTVTGKETVLYSFTGGTDGEGPFGSLVRDASGNLYGTTSEFGTGKGSCCGTVFKLDSAGKLTTLHTFTGGFDGNEPQGSLVRDAAGNLYGVTAYGGRSGCNGPGGCGVVFEVKTDTARSYTVLHIFSGGNDGAIGNGGLAMDSAGNLYGTTVWGGDTNCNAGYGCGTVFKLDATGTETVLFSFNAGTEGGFPYDGPVIDAAGNLYGTTSEGGDLGCDAGYGCGAVFKLDTTGTETVLYGFTGGQNGSGPLAGVFLNAAGNLYGTTYTGGDMSCSFDGSVGCGTVFELKH